MKRSRSPSPPPRYRPSKEARRDQQSKETRRIDDSSGGDGVPERKRQESFAREQTRLNQIQEAEQMREWVSKEDEFVLKQSKKKAQIRVREGRAKPIDWLAVILSIIDPTKDLLDDESADSELDIMDPDGLIEGLNSTQLQELEKDIGSYMALESNLSNLAYWNVSLPTPPFVSEYSHMLGYESHMPRSSNPHCSDRTAKSNQHSGFRRRR